MANRTKYNFATITVSKNQAVDVDSECNSVSFINTGTSIVHVNGIPLHPGTPGTNNGESFSIPGNQDEIFFGRIDVAFAAGGAPELLVIQKFYLP